MWEIFYMNSEVVIPRNVIVNGFDTCYLPCLVKSSGVAVAEKHQKTQMFYELSPNISNVWLYLTDFDPFEVFEVKIMS